MTTIVGLDLSTTNAAAVSVPLDWDGRWSRVHCIEAGESLRKDATDAERARRTETIASRILAFGASQAWIESYAFSRSTAAHTLGELGGVVRLELVRAGIEVRTANVGTARKLLLGKVPRSDIKIAVQLALRAAGAPVSWSPDECDAFVAANFGLSEHAGAFCFAQQERRRRGPGAPPASMNFRRGRARPRAADASSTAERRAPVWTAQRRDDVLREPKAPM